MRLTAVLQAGLAVLAAGALRADTAFVGGDTEPYFVVFLRPYPHPPPLDKAEEDRIQGAHMANILKMAADGVLIASGPMADKPATINGLFVIKAPSLAEARRIVLQDPAVAGRRNRADVHRWNGPKGIGVGYFQWKREHPDADDKMGVHAFGILMRAAPVATDAKEDGEHAVFVDSLRHAGVLAAAGLTPGDPDIYGLCIFKTGSIDEAKRILDQDPIVKSGLVTPEIHRWWTADLVLPW
jgi:uncharacterized protein YciI